MDMIRKGYAGLLGPKGQLQTATETVEKLCDRIASATLLEDRHAAVLGLKSMSREYQLDVGTKGMGILMNVIANDKDDPEILRASLETLINICTSQKVGSDQDLGVMFTEIFIKEPSNVSLLLNILETYDFYVRFSAIQLLALLLSNRSKQLQDCILLSTMGMSRLMDLLNETREIIRNESLLLLIALTTSNTEIQKIVAFEGAFDRLLGIIYEEGLSDGGIIVADCLQLMNNLLRQNVSNQNYFRETSCVQKLIGFFDGVQLNNKEDWQPQKVQNLVLMLEVVRLFVNPRATPTNTLSNQEYMRKAGLLEPIITLALNDSIPTKVKQEALYTCAELIRGCQESQATLAKSIVPVNQGSKVTPQSALIHLIYLCVSSSSDYLLRAAASYTFQSYLHKMPNSQLSIAKTLSPPGEQFENSIGSFLFSSFLEWSGSRKDPYVTWFAANTLSQIIKGNNKCKELMLGMNIQLHEKSPMDLKLFPLLSNALLLSEDPDLRVILAYLTFLLIFLHESPQSVSTFISEGSNIQYLQEQISRSNKDPLIQGLASLVLGVLILYNDDSNPSFTRQSIQTIITKRIGADEFLSKLNALRDSDYIKHFSDLNTLVKSVDTNGLPKLYFDPEFVPFIRDLCDPVAKIVVSDLKQLDAEKKKQDEAISIMETSDSIVNSYKTVIRDQDAKIVALKAELAEIKAQNGSSGQTETHLLQEKDNEILRLTQENSQLLQEKNSLIAEAKKYQDELLALQAEQNDLLVLLAEQDVEKKTLKNRLRKLGEEVEDDEEDEEDDEE